eukprot:3909741-Prymnesium_polylepis.1
MGHAAAGQRRAQSREGIQTERRPAAPRGEPEESVVAEAQVGQIACREHCTQSGDGVARVAATSTILIDAAKPVVVQIHLAHLHKRLGQRNGALRPNVVPRQIQRIHARRQQHLRQFRDDRHVPATIGDVVPRQVEIGDTRQRERLHQLEDGPHPLAVVREHVVPGEVD